jgi:large subunit ribosomal protein L17e
MSTPVGFRYLYDAGYIDREMDMWFNVSGCHPPKVFSLIIISKERNIYYVVQVEVFLSKVFNSTTDEDDDILYVLPSSSEYGLTL